MPGLLPTSALVGLFGDLDRDALPSSVPLSSLARPCLPLLGSGSDLGPRLDSGLDLDLGLD